MSKVHSDPMYSSEDVTSPFSPDFLQDIETIKNMMYDIKNVLAIAESKGISVFMDPDGTDTWVNMSAKVKLKVTNTEYIR